MRNTKIVVLVLAGCLVWAQSASAVIVRLTTPTTSVVEYTSIADLLTDAQANNTQIGWDFITREGDWFDIEGKIYRVHNGGSTPTGSTAIIEYADIGAVQADNQSSHLIASGIDYIPQGSGWFDFGGSIWRLTSNGPTLPNKTRVVEYTSVANVITDTQANSTDITADLVSQDGAWFDFDGRIYRLFNGGSTPAGSTALIEYASIADVLADNQASHTIINGVDYITNDTAWFDVATVPEPNALTLSMLGMLLVVNPSRRRQPCRQDRRR